MSLLQKMTDLAKTRTQDTDLMQDAIPEKRSLVALKDAPHNARPRKDAGGVVNNSDNSVSNVSNVTNVNTQQYQATQEQTGVLHSHGEKLDEQTSLMQKQASALVEMGGTMESLYDFLYKQGTKLQPKIQERDITDKVQRVPTTNDNPEKRGELIRNLFNGGGDDDGFSMGGKKKGGFLKRAAGGILRKGAGMVARVGLAKAAIPLAMIGGGLLIRHKIKNYTYDKKDANSVESGWQSAKDWLGDKLGDGGTGANLERYKKDTEKVNAVSEAAQNDSSLGAVATGFTANGSDVSTVNVGKTARDGASYGKHKLSSKDGSMINFLRSEQGQPFYNHFQGTQPGSPEFNEKYTELTKDPQQAKALATAQQQFVATTHYKPLAEWFGKQYDVDVEGRSRALREMLFSVATQYSAKDSKQLIADVLGNRDVDKMDDKEIINRIQSRRTTETKTGFFSMAEGAELARRAADEHAVYMKMLENEGASVAKNVGDTTTAAEVAAPANPAKPEASAAPEVAQKKNDVAAAPELPAVNPTETLPPKPPEKEKVKEKAEDVAVPAPTSKPSAKEKEPEPVIRTVQLDVSKQETAPKLGENGITTRDLARWKATKRSEVARQYAQPGEIMVASKMNPDGTISEVQFQRVPEKKKPVETKPVVPEAKPVKTEPAKAEPVKAPAPKAETVKPASPKAPEVVKPAVEVKQNGAQVEKQAAVTKPEAKDAVVAPKATTEVVKPVAPVQPKKAEVHAEPAVKPKAPEVNVPKPEKDIPVVKPVTTPKAEPANVAVTPVSSKATVDRVDSPASADYYKSEPAINTAQKASANRVVVNTDTSGTYAEKVERQPYESVKRVMAVDQPPVSTETPKVAANAAPAQHAGSGTAGRPTLADIPALVDDYGLLFLNSGFV